MRLHGKDTDLLGISRDAERIANDAAAALGIAPAVAAEFDGGVVTRFLVCDGLTPGEVAGAALEIGRALRAFHDSGARLPVSFSVPSLLADYDTIIADRGAGAPEGWGEIVAASDRIAAALGTVEARPCHNDLLAGNIIRSREDGSIMLVDWEYAGMGDPYFDLGNLAVNNGFDEQVELHLLEAYHGEPATPARLAHLRLMRVMSDAREAAWGIVQGALSALDFDFGGYAEDHLARLRASIEAPSFERELGLAGGRA